MATFEYTRENYTLEAYGKDYEIPTKTAALIDNYIASSDNAHCWHNIESRMLVQIFR